MTDDLDRLVSYRRQKVQILGRLDHTAQRNNDDIVQVRGADGGIRLPSISALFPNTISDNNGVIFCLSETFVTREISPEEAVEFHQQPIDIDTGELIGHDQLNGFVKMSGRFYMSKQRYRHVEANLRTKNCDLGHGLPDPNEEPTRIEENEHHVFVLRV